MKKMILSFILAGILFVSCNPGPAEPLAASVFYNFDSSLDGWNSNGIANEILTLNTDTNYIQSGAGSVKCAVTLSTSVTRKIGLLFQDFAINQNITSRNVKIWIYVPLTLAERSPGYRLYLYVKRQSMGTVLYTIYGAALDTQGWNEVTFEIPAYTTDSSSVAHDFSDVQMMYFSVDNGAQTPADWTGDIYFDELSW